MSVLIPTYNRASLLERALRSVLAQTIDDFEIVIVDDGSEDETPAMIDELGDRRLRYHRLPHTGHLSRVRNVSVALARGEFVAFLDSDDRWRPDKLARQLAYLDARPARAFCVTEVERVTAEGELAGGIYAAMRERAGNDRSYEAPMLESLLRGEFVIYPSAMMTRRAALLDVGGFDERLRTGDSECFFRLAHAHAGALLFDPLVEIHAHEGNCSRRWAVDAYDEMLHGLTHFCSLGVIDESWAEPLRRRYTARREQAIEAGGRPWR